MKKYTWVGISIIIVGVALILVFTVVYKPNEPPNLPVVISPEDSQENVNFNFVTLSWKCSDPNGDELIYTVYLGRTRDDMTPIATDITSESLKVNDLEPNTVYYWKVVAVDSKGAERSGEIWKFKTKENRTPVLSLKSPENDAQITRSEISLEWSAADPDGDPLRFDVYLGSPEPKLLAKNIKDTVYRVSGLEFGKIYGWRVVAKDDHGGQTTSPTRRFAVIEKPKLLKPTTGSEVSSREVILEWSVKNPSAYKFDLLLGKTAGNLKIVAKDLKKTRYVLRSLEPSTSYLWRVVLKLDGFESKSDIWNFKTSKINNPPSPPTSPSPPNGAVDVDTNPVLSWDCSDVDGDKLSYVVYLGVSGSTPTVVASGLTDSRLKLNGLKTGTKYVWRVVAYDSKGASTEGELWSFTTVATPNTPPSPPVVLSPKRTQNLPTSVKLAWRAVDPDGDTLTYDLYFGESPNPPLLASDLKDPEYEVKDLEYDKTYYWYVVAKDPKGATSVSEIWKFKTRVKILQKPLIDRLLLSGGPEGIFVVDVSDPAYPRVMRKIPVSTYGLTALTIDVYGKKLRVIYGASKGKIVVFKYDGESISKLTELLGPNGTEIYVKDLENFGSDIAVSFGISGLGVVDSRYPANPEWIWSVEDLGGVVGGVFASGDELFVACGIGGVSVVSPNGSTHNVRKLDLDANVSDVFVRGDSMYVVDLKRGLKIYDISDLSIPKLLSSVPVEGALALTVSATVAYLVGEYGLTVVDVSDEASPSVLSSLSLEGESRDVLVKGPYAYVAGDELVVVDVSDPKKPVPLGRLDFGGLASAVTGDEKAIYVADKGKGVKVFDPKDISLINEFDSADFISDIEISGDDLYIIDRIDGLLVLDPKTGELIKRLFLPGFAKKMVLGGGIALVVSEFSKEVSVIDVKDPDDPKLLPSIEVERTPSDVVWLGGGVFAVVGDGISVLNLEDPTKPSVIASVDLSGVANSAAARDGYLAVSIDGFGVVLYDVSDPSRPKRVRSLEVESPRFVSIHRNLLLIGNEDGVELVDLENLKTLSRVELPAPASDAVLIGSRIYLADSDNGLVVLDVSDPSKPKIVKDIDWLNFYDVDTPPREEKE